MSEALIPWKMRLKEPPQVCANEGCEKLLTNHQAMFCSSTCFGNHGRNIPGRHPSRVVNDVWTQERIDYLVANYPDVGSKVVAEQLGMKRSQVHAKAGALKLRLKPRPKVVNSRHGECSACGGQTATKEITLCLKCIMRETREKRRCIECGKERIDANDSVPRRCKECELDRLAGLGKWTDRLKEPHQVCAGKGCSNLLKNPQDKYCSKACHKSSDEYQELWKERLKKCIRSRSKSQKLRPSKLEFRLIGILKSLGVAFDPQYVIKERFIVDVRIGTLIIQADGEYWHGHPKFEPLTPRQVKQQAKDASQDKYLVKCGYVVERIWERDMTAENVAAIVERHKDRLDQVIVAPRPKPSPTYASDAGPRPAVQSDGGPAKQMTLDWGE